MGKNHTGEIIRTKGEHLNANVAKVVFSIKKKIKLVDLWQIVSNL
jgi:hypothetical protein